MMMWWCWWKEEEDKEGLQLFLLHQKLPSFIHEVDGSTSFFFVWFMSDRRAYLLWIRRKRRWRWLKKLTWQFQELVVFVRPLVHHSLDWSSFQRLVKNGSRRLRRWEGRRRRRMTRTRNFLSVLYAFCVPFLLPCPPLIPVESLHDEHHKARRLFNLHIIINNKDPRLKMKESLKVFLNL